MKSRIDLGLHRSRSLLQSQIAEIESQIQRVTATEIAPLAEKIRLAQAMSDRASLTRARLELNRWTHWISRRRATCEAKKRELASLLTGP